MNQPIENQNLPDYMSTEPDDYPSAKKKKIKTFKLPKANYEKI